ncbi:MAG: hypothetical protein AAF236_01870, partial [Verrucomicrobiota bacterium]
MDEAHRFVEREIEEARRNPPLFNRDDIKGQRELLRERLGVVDTRLTPRLEFVTDAAPDLDGEVPTSLVAESDQFEVHQVRWDVLDGFTAEGLYVMPVSKGPDLVAPPGVVIMPDSDHSPEDLLGLTSALPSKQRIGARFAEAGFHVLIATPISRGIYSGENQDVRLRRSNQTHREWIYRMAFQMGRHVIGYEIQTLLAAGDWLREHANTATVSAAGFGEG